MDHTCIIYLICACTGLYGFCLFIWEWWRKRPAVPSGVFRAVTAVMGGVFIIVTVNLAARFLRHDYSIFITDHWYWPFRWYPVMFALIYLNYHLTKKLFIKEEEEKSVEKS